MTLYDRLNYYAFSVQVTTEKLEELKENIPRAGPKYRLGMYFETIHDLEKFDDICHPEDGYTSYWETDTEVDEELGNFLFSNVTGDSASVICIDEAMDLIAMREEQQQRNQMMQRESPHYSTLENEHLYHHPQHPSQHPLQHINGVRSMQHTQEEHILERSNESKRSAASRHSRRSHNSGSDGAYDEPPPVPPPRRQTSSPPALSPEEHTYETLDDCQEEYAIYIAKGSDGSRGSADSTAKPVSNDECDSADKAANRSSKSPVQIFSKPRSSSIPQPFEGVNIRHRRKNSEPVSSEFGSSRKRRSEKVCPKNSYPPPVRGYQLPAGVPEEYADYMALPGTTTPERRSLVPPTSPTRRGSQPTVPVSPDRLSRLENRKSNGSGTAKTARTPSLLIRHKGKTFFIPVVDKKLQQKLEKVKGPPQTCTPMLQRHTTINTSISRSSSGFGTTGVYQTINPAHHQSMRSHASPPKVDPCEQATPHKRKNSKTSQLPSTPKQVTHYGVL